MGPLASGGGLLPPCWGEGGTGPPRRGGPTGYPCWGGRCMSPGRGVGPGPGGPPIDGGGVKPLRWG